MGITIKTHTYFEFYIKNSSYLKSKYMVKINFKLVYANIEKTIENTGTGTDIGINLTRLKFAPHSYPSFNMLKKEFRFNVFFIQV